MRKSTKGEWIALVLTAVWAIIVIVSVYKAYYHFPSICFSDISLKFRVEVNTIESG